MRIYNENERVTTTCEKDGLTHIIVTDKLIADVPLNLDCIDDKGMLSVEDSQLVILPYYDDTLKDAIKPTARKLARKTGLSKWLSNYMIATSIHVLPVLDGKYTKVNLCIEVMPLVHNPMFRASILAQDDNAHDTAQWKELFNKLDSSEKHYEKSDKVTYTIELTENEEVELLSYITQRLLINA